MFPGEEIFAQIGANGEIFFAGVDFRFETLVIIHEEFHAGDVLGFLRGLHMADEVVHPQHQVADHAEEAEEISRVGQLVLSGLDGHLEVAPGLDDFGFSVGDFFSLVAGVGGLQLGGFFLHRLNLFGERQQIPLEVVMFALKTLDGIGVASEIFAQSSLLLRDLRQNLFFGEKKEK